MSDMIDGWQSERFELVYDDPAENSHKFYIVTRFWNHSINDYRVLFEYGRKGSLGQSTFKICVTEGNMCDIANRRVDSKLRKGYVGGGWTSAGLHRSKLNRIGINTFIAPTPVDADADEAGVTFEQMADVVGALLSKAVEKDNDTVDVMVEAAQMNAKFATLRAQFDDVKSQVEFTNSAVRARL